MVEEEKIGGRFKHSHWTLPQEMKPMKKMAGKRRGESQPEIWRGLNCSEKIDFHIYVKIVTSEQGQHLLQDGIFLKASSLSARSQDHVSPPKCSKILCHLSLP